MALKRAATLVSTNWLRENINQAVCGTSLRVLDTSFVPDLSVDAYTQYYQEAHIPSAVFFDQKQCVNSTQEIPRNLPDTNCFTEYVRKLGVASDSHIISYDRLNTRAALRAWWLFRVLGHRNISILDGGMVKWVEDGFWTTTEQPEPFEETDFVAKLDKSLLRTFEDMEKNLNSGAEQVVDARGISEFMGSPDKPKSGHIPGSKLVSFTSLFTEEGTFKSKEDLIQLFEKAGVDLGKPMVASCFLGMTACGISAAAKIAADVDVPVYGGSFNEWSQRASDDMIATGKS